VPQDPLRFRDDKRYTDRLRDARAKTGQEDALVAARGTIDGLPITSLPARARAWQILCPKPPLPPVTIATVPFSCMSVSSCSLR
jgi:hypothetical protein